jgi:hypothetical protein
MSILRIMTSVVLLVAISWIGYLEGIDFNTKLILQAGVFALIFGSFVLIEKRTKEN